MLRNSMTLLSINIGLIFSLLLSCAPNEIQSVENSQEKNSTTQDKDPFQSSKDTIGKETPKDQKDLAIKEVMVGAQNTAAYFPTLKDKRVGVVANQASTIRNTHLVDSLIASNINVARVFSPEHGFRGNHDAGAKVKHSKDPKTGLPIFSLHGKTKKPSNNSIENIDVMIFDLQDVGVRFYTYLSTLHYVLEACGEAGIPVILLDRPNPNAHYVAGPVLLEEHKSFLGLHPVPIVYGMSIGEYAQMIIGEKWLANGVNCDLTVIKNQNWTHNTVYELPVSPSPNLPNQTSIYLYPHLCFFEGSSFSVGRGTKKPFQQYGHPSYRDSSYSFTPVSTPGASLHPKLENQKCFGKDLSSIGLDSLRNIHKIEMNWFIDAYRNHGSDKKFISRNAHLKILAGYDQLPAQLKENKTSDEINDSWKDGLEQFKAIRSRYLLYP